MRLKTESAEKLCAFCVVSVLALFAMAATVQDRFASTTISSAWLPTESGGAHVRQSRGRLLFSAAHESDIPSFAGLLSANFALDFSKPWSVAFDYALKQGRAPTGATSGALLLMGFGNEDDGEAFGRVVGITVYRSPTGTFLGRIASGQAGIVGPEPIAAVPATGTLTISYNAALDRMQMRMRNMVIATIEHYRSSQGLGIEAKFGIGCLTQHGTGDYRFTDAVQVDNFQATGDGVVAHSWQ